MIEIEDLEKVCEIAQKYKVSYIEYKKEHSSIIVKNEKNNGREGAYESLPSEEVAKLEESNSELAESKSEKLEVEKPKSLKEEEKKYIKSTLMGRFYTTKEKGKEPLVKEGDKIEIGTVIGVVEVMKLFNDVESSMSGEVLKILVEDGDLVEYGQPLIELK